MPTNFKFKITPHRGLFPEYPSFELHVKSSGWVFTDYTWSCLPGHTAITSGVVGCAEELTGNYSFYLYTKEMRVFDSVEDNPCYGILCQIPTDFSVGSKGFAMVDYGGYKAKKIWQGKGDVLHKIKEIFQTADKSNLYSEWELTDAY